MVKGVAKRSGTLKSARPILGWSPFRVTRSREAKLRVIRKDDESLFFWGL